MNRKERRSRAAQQRQVGEVLAPSAGSPVAKHLELGVRLRDQGLLNEALESIERAVSHDPTSIQALSELAQVQRLMEQPSRAAMTLRKALQAAPKQPEILANLAVTLRDLGELNEAVRALKRAVELRPAFHQAHSELGSTLQVAGQPGAAVESYEKALALEARQPGVLSSLGFACLDLGDPQAAIEACERCFELDPHSVVATMVKSYALDELGSPEEAQALMDLERLIVCVPLEQVDGFESVQEFNSALVQHVTGHPSLKLEPNQRTTRLGQQTGELTREPRGPIAQLERTLDGAVKRYLDELPREQAHPYLGHRPGSWRMSIWGTILGAQGHQSPHMHPIAWVSGTYYAQLPEVVKQGGEGQEGWIEFGCPPPSFQLQREPRLRRIHPKEGTLVLFPSYFYHRTIPFESETKRISLAMDAVALS